MANTLIFLLQLLNRVESLVQTEYEQAAGVNGNCEARVKAPLVDVGSVGAAQVRHQQPPVFLLQPSVRARNCIFFTRPGNARSNCERFICSWLL